MPSAALLLEAGQTAQGLVGDILPQPFLANLRALARRTSLDQQLAWFGREPGNGPNPPAGSCVSGWSTRRTVTSPLAGHGNAVAERILSMAVPQRTAVLPPAFSAMLPPMVEAQALVGSVAKTSFSPGAGCGHGVGEVTTPASTLQYRNLGPLGLRWGKGRLPIGCDGWW
jgi:hypothetical protein